MAGKYRGLYISTIMVWLIESYEAIMTGIYRGIYLAIEMG
jgi:hypothetical protein